MIGADRCKKRQHAPEARCSVKLAAHPSLDHAVIAIPKKHCRRKSEILEIRQAIFKLRGQALLQKLMREIKLLIRSIAT